MLEQTLGSVRKLPWPARPLKFSFDLSTFSGALTGNSALTVASFGTLLITKYSW